MGKLKVLFICTGNSVRSQMAEALIKKMAGDKFEAYSAGISPAYVHPFTIQVMKEIGISMDGHRSKHISEVENIEFDYVINLCEVAAMSCSNLKGKVNTLSWFIEDPIRILGDDERKLNAFRITRDILKNKISKFIKETTHNL
ncbi:MAG: arsenate reductase ArsC [Candidatus Marinimicrobia bacterium]|nr:arsenate reductase ArsC [Candidatus Neomarinimicrobiota bacterium]